MSSFYDLPNVIVTPHTAWSSGRVLDRSVELFCDNLRRFAPGSRCSTWWTRAPATEPGRQSLDMQIAIVGLAGSGKTTVFNTLTRGHAETGGYGGVTLNVGVVKVPDDRLDTLADHLQAQEDRPCRRDLRGPARAAGLVRGPHRHRGAAGRPPRAGCATPTRCSMSSRAFEDPANPHPDGSVDPVRDIEQLDLEFLLADLAMAERRLERLKTSGGTGRRPSARPPSARRSSCAGSTPGSRPARRSATSGLDADDEKAIRGFRFLTQKPVLVLLNVGEADLAAAPALVARVTAALPATSTRWSTALSAKIEMELGELEPDEAAVFMEELGIAESGLGPGHRAVVPAARPDLVPDRRPRRGPRLADPRRLDRGRRGRRRSTPTSPGASSGPRRSATRTWSPSARWPRRASRRLRSEGKTYRVARRRRAGDPVHASDQFRPAGPRVELGDRRC